MAAFAPIVLLDGAATPVSRTFSPISIDVAGVAKLADRSTGIAIGFPVISLSCRAPSKASRNFRVSGKVVVPTLEATSPSTATGIQPAPTKAYELLGTFEFVLPERSTLAERTNVIAFVKNFMASTAVDTAVKQFETIY